MTQEEKLIARLKTLDPSSLYDITVYIASDGSLGFWVVKKQEKVEGEKRDLQKK